jgi:hypothetical protein
MFRLTFAIGCSAFLLLTTQAAFAAEPPAAATQWIPHDALIVTEIARPRAILDRAFSDQVVKTVTSLAAYEEQMAKPGALQAMNLVNYFERKYDSDIETLLGKLLGGGITWAVGPGEANLLIVEAEDGKMLEEVHEFFLMMARNETQKQGRGDGVASAEYRGITVWRFGPNEAHAIVGNRLLLTNKPELLKTVMDLRAQPDKPCFADSKNYQEAKQAAGEDAVATVFANMDVLKQIPDLKTALSEQENPLTTLLFAPLQKSLREASWVALAAGIDGDTLQFNLITDGTAGDASAPDGFAVPKDPGEGALPNLTVPKQIAGVSLYRDLYHYYAAKDELFPERTSGLIFFENMMGIFFTGRDLTEEVLAETAPDIRVVVSEQRYDSSLGTPQVQFPGFALVLRMRDRDKFAPIVEEAWQKAIGLVNFTRGQQAEPGLIIDKPTHADVTYTTAAFSAAGEEDRSAVDTRFNFQPSLAMPGDYLILSSCDGLTRDVIDAINQQSDASQPLAGVHSLAVIGGPQLESILNSNFEAMVRQNMVEDGNTREQAEQQLRIIMTVLKHIRQVSVSAATADGQSQLTLKVDFDLAP